MALRAPALLLAAVALLCASTVNAQASDPPIEEWRAVARFHALEDGEFTAEMAPSPYGGTREDILAQMSVEYRIQYTEPADSWTQMAGGEDPVVPVGQLPSDRAGPRARRLPPWLFRPHWTSAEERRLARLFAVVAFGVGQIEGDRVRRYRRICVGTIVESPAPELGAGLYLLTAAHCLFDRQSNGSYGSSLADMVAASQPSHKVLQHLSRTYLHQNARVESAFLECLFPRGAAPQRWEQCVRQGHRDVALVPIVFPREFVDWPAWRCSSSSAISPPGRLRAYAFSSNEADGLEFQSGRFGFSSAPARLIGRAAVGREIVGTRITWGDSGGPALDYEADNRMSELPPEVHSIVIGRDDSLRGEEALFLGIADLEWTSLVPVARLLNLDGRRVPPVTPAAPNQLPP